MLKSDICINLKTTYDKKNGTFNDTIFKFNQKLINILKLNKILQSIYFFSGLGVDKDKNSKEVKQFINLRKKH